MHCTNRNANFARFVGDDDTATHYAGRALGVDRIGATQLTVYDDL